MKTEHFRPHTKALRDLRSLIQQVIKLRQIVINHSSTIPKKYLDTQRYHNFHPPPRGIPTNLKLIFHILVGYVWEFIDPLKRL